LLFAKSSPATFIIPLVFYFTLAPLLLLVALNYTIRVVIYLNISGTFYPVFALAEKWSTPSSLA
jgi:hypothetical protein